jgi:hypothetical protein
MATPMNDENVEKLLEPFRTAVKIQVQKEKKYFFIIINLLFF